MINMFYSAKNNGFYCADLRAVYDASANGWPDDAIHVTSADYENLLQGQSAGRIITAGSDGQPILSDPVINWQDRAEQQRKNCIATANETTSDWRTELQLDVITDDDRISLTNWMAYIRALKTLDLSAVDSEASFDAVDWPAEPEQ